LNGLNIGGTELKMRALFRLDDTRKRHPLVGQWLRELQGSSGAIARRWFESLRACGPDVRETMHDGQATVCVEGAAFAYVAAFSKHVTVGFFQGAALPDPSGLLEGTGKYMRHVKPMPDAGLDAPALLALINAAYLDVKERIGH
jgi:hypothetical protein